MSHKKKSDYTRDEQAAIDDFFKRREDAVGLTPFIRSAYDGLNDKVSNQTSLSFPSSDDEFQPTVQADKDACDINILMATYARTGLDQFAARVHSGVYADLVNMPEDYQASLNFINDANAAFADLPAALRREFDNDPAQFLSFIETGDRADFVRLGLIPPPDDVSPPETGKPLPPKGGSKGARASDEAEDKP